MSTIINNAQFPVEVSNLITNPITYIPDPNVSKALSGAQMFFGVVGTDPEIEENQKKVYSLQEDKAAINMPQPIICSAGGVPQLNGDIVALGISGSYSLKILDKNGNQEYYFPSVAQADNQGYSGVIIEESQTVTGGNLTLTYANIEASTASFYISSTTGGAAFTGAYLKKDVDYTVDTNEQITLLNATADGNVVLGRELDPVGQVLPFRANANYIFNFSIISDAVESDLILGDSVIIDDALSADDQLGGAKYKVVSGGTGAQDGINFIDLDNGLQLQLITNYNKFAAYSEKTNPVISSSNILNIDLKFGQVFTCILTENTTLTPIVYNTLTGITNTFTLKVTQDGSGGHSMTWPASIRWTNGTPPIITTTANATDRYIFITDDGGVTWDGITSGKAFS